MEYPTIGVFSKQLDNWTSGSGHHLNEMMQHILDMNTKLRFVFIHYSPSENPIYRRIDEEIIIPRNPLKAATLLRQHHFDVLHFTPLTVFSPIWGIPGKKTATIHGIEQLLVPQFYGRLEMLHERLLVPIYARKMDHIITVSHTSKNYFIDHFGVKPERVTVCYNAVNDTYQVQPKEVDKQQPPSMEEAGSGLHQLRKGQLGPGQRYVFHMSRFSERKNPWTLLQGFAEFATRPTAQDVNLVIAGGRWDNEQVRKELHRLKIEDKVVLTGFVGEDEAVTLFNNASVFVFPSLAEGFGMPNIEAMACGCPVITSPIFAIPEVVGNAAMVMDNPQDANELADLMEKMLSDEDLRQNYVQRGLEHAKQFRSWKPSASKMLRVWEELAGV